MNIAIINGPNLNLLGRRELDIYGTQSFDEYFEELKANFPKVTFTYFQSNVEGELINAIQAAAGTADGIVLNPGGYTHTSVAIGDAIAASEANVLEVHISNINAREEFRKISHVSSECVGTITGLGLKGYELAVRWFLERSKT